jgi:hypothetical protein
MHEYVIFLNDETWVIISADDFILNAVEQMIEFYKNHEMIASFSMIKTIGFTRYEYALMRILKGQKVCNGFEGVDENGK